MIHLLSYVPEMRGSKTQMIEEPIELHNVKISLRSDGRSTEESLSGSWKEITAIQGKRRVY